MRVTTGSAPPGGVQPRALRGRFDAVGCGLHERLREQVAPARALQVYARALGGHVSEETVALGHKAVTIGEKRFEFSLPGRRRDR